ncbi:hypothetical protein V8C34DRAFT_299747 [Trichoderma compactum]
MVDTDKAQTSALDSMDNAQTSALDTTQICEQDLDTLHSSVFAEISSKITDPKVQWKQLPLNIQQCKDETLISLTLPLKPMYFDVKILQYNGPAIITLYHTGDFIPLQSCADCSILDGKQSYQLNVEKKYHLSRRCLQLHIGKDCTLYLLLLFKSKGERDKL